MISHYDSLIVRHVTFFLKQLKQFDMKICPPPWILWPTWVMIGSLIQELLPDPCSVISTYLVVYGLCLVSEVIGAVFWICEHWGRKESTDILCGWYPCLRQGQFWFFPELELIIGCFLPIPFFPSIPSFFFQRRFPCHLVQHPSKPSWHPQSACTQWYSPAITVCLKLRLLWGCPVRGRGCSPCGFTWEDNSVPLKNLS